MTVNRTDLGGRAERNITQVRALFADSDNGDISIPDGAPDPSIMVQSIGGQHAYWLVEPGSVELDAFSALQHGLAVRLGTDRNVKGLPQVMRLPGFFHQKGEPRLVTLVTSDPTKVYAATDLIDGLKIDPQSGESNVIEFTQDELREKQANKLERCSAYMAKLSPAVEGQAGDKATLLAAMVGGDFDIGDDQFWPLLCDWNQTCQPPWNDRELSRKLQHAHKYRKRPYGWRLIEDNRVVYISDRSAEDEAYWDRVLAEADDEVRHQSQGARSGGWGGDGDGDGDGDGGGDGDGDSRRRRRRRSPRVFSTFQAQTGAAPPEELPPRVMGEMMLRDNQIMQHVSKAIYQYNGTFWTEISDKYLTGMALEYDHFSNTTHRRRVETVNHVLARTQTKEVHWNNIKKYEIPLKQGVLNVLNGVLREHDWEDFLDACLPHEWAPDARCPIWSRCLDDWFQGEDDKRMALQEFFGYIALAGTNEYKKALFLYGESNTGKSVVASVARELVGLPNLCQIRLEDMDDPKKRAPIKGKMLNLITEVGAWSTLSDSGFKMLVSTGDPVEIEKKYVNSMTVIPTCKHMIATNNLPNITDQTEAVYNRLLILEFKNILSQNKMDPHLLDRLKGEMQGILAWAVEGARRLVESSGIFTRVSSSDRIIRDYKDTNNRVKMFIEHGGVIVQEPDAKIRTNRFRELFNRYKGGKPVGPRLLIQWCRTAGLEVPEKKIGGYRYVVGCRELTAAEQSEAGGQLRMLTTTRKKAADDFDF